MELVLIIQIKI